MNISDLLHDATSRLSTEKIASARLDTEILLSAILDKDRTWLSAHSDNIVDPNATARFNELLSNRLARVPLAYILNKKEFYGLDFIVNPDVLIPRPETEQIIEYVKAHYKTGDKILDVGTGSGAIAITLALELDNPQVVASDISSKALSVATENADKLNAKVDFVQSDLLDSITGKFDFITANLPYVDRTWETSPEVRFEPDLALFADDNGTSLIKKLVEQAPEYLRPNGKLVLEIDPRQSDELTEYVKPYSLSATESRPFMLVLQKD